MLPVAEKPYKEALLLQLLIIKPHSIRERGSYKKQPAIYKLLSIIYLLFFRETQLLHLQKTY